MIPAPAPFLCHIEETHGPHEWFPMVPDPHIPRVFHIGMASVHCPGRTTTSEGTH